MNFALTDDQALIRDTAESFLAKHSDSQAVRKAMATPVGYEPKLWQRIGEELGWCATHIPEDYGGLGLSWVELTLLTEQMGRRLLCAPFFSTVCLAATALLETAGADAKRRYLPEIAAGKLRASVALADTGVDWNPRGRPATARKSGQQYLMNGRFGHVPDGATAQLLLIPARIANKWALFALPADSSGVSRVPLNTLDQTRRLAELRLDNVQVPLDAKLADGPAVAEGLARTCALAAIALAAEQVGGAQQCLDLTLAYVAERTQFGRKIASFQAVKHRCAEMMVKIEAARSAVYGAARAVHPALPTTELKLEAAGAKVCAADAFFYCASEAIQLHGGVGFTWEYDPQLYFKRAQATSHWFGSSDALRERVAGQLFSSPPPNPPSTGSEPAPYSIRGQALPQGEGELNDDRFREEVAAWMREHLVGDFAVLKHHGGPGDEDAYPELRKRWERELAAEGWTCVGWPKACGGRALSLAQQVIFHEEYARVGGPGRMGHIGEGLIGPTLIAHGSEAQKNKYLPGIVAGTEFWCQGYSEPNAGSDLANVQTRALQDPSNGDWIIDGQKVWTSLAHESQWIFVVARCDPNTKGNRGLCFLLVPLNQPGIEIRPIEQLTGTAEFNEVFFDGARTAADNLVGKPGEGWSIAMALLGFERGVSTLGQQMHFAHELELVCAAAKSNGSARDPVIRNRIAQAWLGLKAMRYNALRTLSGAQDGKLQREAMMYKYYWSNWHRDLGKLAMDVLGAEGDIVSDDPERTRLQQLFLFTRADTIYAGTNEIQLNIIAERALGMPKEPRPSPQSPPTRGGEEQAAPRTVSPVVVEEI